MLPIVILAIEDPADRDLMAEFYESYNLLMYSEARKYLNISEDAEDIVYEALTKIIEKIEIFRNLAQKQKVQYAITTVKNLSYIFLKRSNHFTMVSFDEFAFNVPFDDGNSAEAIVEKKDAISQIKKIWKELSFEDRMLLEQKYLLQWKDEEIAEKLGIQAPSVRMRFTRAKRKLLAELQSKGFDFPIL